MKQRILSIVLIAFICLLMNAVPSQAQTTGEPKQGVVLFVEFTFDEKDMDTALELLNELQMQVLENEEGCIAYDLLLSNDNPTKVYLYESYEDAEALKKHNNTPYFKDIVTVKLPKYIKESKIINLYPLNSDDEEGLELDAEP